MAASGQKREHEIFTTVDEGEPLNYPLVFFAHFNEKRRRERGSDVHEDSVHVNIGRCINEIRYFRPCNTSPFVLFLRRARCLRKFDRVMSTLEVTSKFPFLLDENKSNDMHVSCRIMYVSSLFTLTLVITNDREIKIATAIHANSFIPEKRIRKYVECTMDRCHYCISCCVLRSQKKIHAIETYCAASIRHDMLHDDIITLLLVICG